MTTYAVHRRTDGVELMRYTADAVVEWQGCELATCTHDIVPDPAAAPPAPAAQIEWTKVEFLRRFSAQERIAIRTLAKDNPMIDDFMQLMSEAPSIHNDDRDVLQALAYLTHLGVLAAGRAAEIVGGH